MNKTNKIVTSLLTLILVIGCIYFYSKRINRLETMRDDFDKFFSQWKVYGVDVSEYQGHINWSEVKKIFGEHQIHFAFIRATAGKDKLDKHFHKNWSAKKDSVIHTGAYHYYRPDENSIEQANNFIKHVSLKRGDLPPVLDIEKRPKVQSMSQLKEGLQKWLDKIEEHYGVKPIIYSGSKYFTTFLQKEFKDYPLWVANYNRTKVPVEHDWHFWQYSDKGRVKGIRRKVDINVFDGDYLELKELILR